MLRGYRILCPSGRVERSWKCVRCDGTGTVPDDTALWIAGGKRLRDLRLAAGISSNDRAAELGIDRVAYNHMEHGRRDPSAALAKVKGE